MLEYSRDRACHELLLRMAGLIPDDTLVRCRAWLGRGQFDELARTLTHAILAARVPLVADELNLLAELHELIGAGPWWLSMVDTTDRPPPVRVDFAPTLAGAEQAALEVRADEGSSAGDGDDGPRPAPGGRSSVGPMIEGPADAPERAVVDAAAAQRVVRGVWRCWRYPSNGAQWPPPKRMFVVETDPAAPMPEITAHLQDVLTDAGEESPQVEVYAVDGPLSGYLYWARGRSALLWSSSPDPGMRVATIFDDIDETEGGSMRADHPRLDAPDRARIVRYLAEGEPLMITSGLMGDVVDPTRGDAVPLTFRTDGLWIWNDATTYYLEQHHLAPVPELVEHVRTLDYVCPLVDGAALHRASVHLQRYLAGEVDR